LQYWRAWKATQQILLKPFLQPTSADSPVESSQLHVQGIPIHTHTHTHTNTHIPTHPHTHTNPHPHPHTAVFSRAATWARSLFESRSSALLLIASARANAFCTYIHVYIYGAIYMCVLCVCVCVYMHIYIYIHICAYVCASARANAFSTVASRGDSCGTAPYASSSCLCVCVAHVLLMCRRPGWKGRPWRPAP